MHTTNFLGKFFVARFSLFINAKKGERDWYVCWSSVSQLKFLWSPWVFLSMLGVVFNSIRGHRWSISESWVRRKIYFGDLLQISSFRNDQNQKSKEINGFEKEKCHAVHEFVRSCKESVMLLKVSFAGMKNVVFIAIIYYILTALRQGQANLPVGPSILIFHQLSKEKNDISLNSKFFLLLDAVEKEKKKKCVGRYACQ